MGKPCFEENLKSLFVQVKGIGERLNEDVDNFRNLRVLDGRTNQS